MLLARIMSAHGKTLISQHKRTVKCIFLLLVKSRKHFLFLQYSVSGLQLVAVKDSFSNPFILVILLACVFAFFF